MAGVAPFRWIVTHDRKHVPNPNAVPVVAFAPSLGIPEKSIYADDAIANLQMLMQCILK